MSRNEKEEGMEHGMSVNQRKEMMGNRSFGEIGDDSPDSIRRAGGEDPRRYDAQIMINRTVMNHDMSGYNHNGVQAPEAATGNNEYKAMMERKVMGMGTPNPDGTYSG